jgi:hypothetical protein
MIKLSVIRVCLLALLIVGGGLYVVIRNKPSADQPGGLVLTEVTSPIELAVYPSVWTVSSRNSGTNMIAVKGANGFSGSVTLTISGLPETVFDRFPNRSELESGKGGYYCSSHCLSAGNGDFPFTLPVTNGAWNGIAPTLLPGSGTESQTSNVTITATANGHAVTKSFTLKIVNDDYTIGPEGPLRNGAADPDVITTVNDASWLSNGEEKYKLTGFAAGTTRVRQIDVSNVGSKTETVELLSNLSVSGLTGVTGEITGGLGVTSLTLAPNERKAVDVTITVSPTTPNGVYEVLFGVKQSDGSNRAGVGFALEITGSATVAVSPSGPTESSAVSIPPSSSPPTSSPSSPASTVNPPSIPPPTLEVTPTQEPSPSSTTAPTPVTTQALSPSPVALPALDLPVRTLSFLAVNGQSPAEQTLEIRNTGPIGSVLKYQTTLVGESVTATPTEGDIPGGASVMLKVTVNHERLISENLTGTIGAIIISERDRVSETRLVEVSYGRQDFTFSLPSLHLEQQFTSLIRPGFDYGFEIVVHNEGTASTTAGILLPIPSEYQLNQKLCQSRQPNLEILACEAGVWAAAVTLAPDAFERVTVWLSVSPERVQFPDQPLESARTLELFQSLPQPKPFIFSTLSPERWQALRLVTPPSTFLAAAFKESLETTEAEIQAFRTLSDQYQYQTLLKLSETHPYFANNLASYVIFEYYNDLSAKQPVIGLQKLPKLDLAGWLPKLNVVRAEEASIWQKTANELRYYKNFGIDLANETATSFKNGAALDGLRGAGSGAVEVATFGLLPDSLPPVYGHQGDYKIGRTVGVVAGTAESFLIPGAFQAGPKAAMVIAKGGAGKEPIHFGVDLIAKGGIAYREGEAVNLVHVGKHVEFGWHAGIYGAGKPFVTQTGQKMVGTWAHFYPAKAYIAGIGEIPYARLVPKVIAGTLFGLFGINSDRSASPRLVAALDPNHLSSTPAEGFIKATQPITFHIDFENLKEAGAAATQVTVTVKVDEDFDIQTTQFLSASQAEFLKTEIDEATGTLTWRFTSLVLPPNITPPEGEGYAEFSIQPKADAVSGAELTSQASIVFDFNPAILTNTVTHRLDDVAPETTLTNAKAEEGRIVINWTAADAGSGLQEVRLLLTPDDGTEGREVVATEQPMIVKVSGGKTYAIRSFAKDKAGNVSELSEPMTVIVARAVWQYLSPAIFLLLAILALGLRRHWYRQNPLQD